MEWKSQRKVMNIPRDRDLRFGLILVAFLVIVPVVIASGLVLMMPTADASDNWEIDGANGVLYVHGALTESACRLEMTSASQDVAMGETGTGRLQRVGDRGTPVMFELRLKDCLRTPASQRDAHTGGLTWSPNQPAVRVSFRAPADLDRPALVKAQGVSGLGLRIQDGIGRDVRLGDCGAPLQLSSGQDSLIYRVMPERTPAELVAGSYRAVVDFHLSYD